jgi:uncharacterized membrane-anchored protein
MGATCKLFWVAALSLFFAAPVLGQPKAAQQNGPRSQQPSAPQPSAQDSRWAEIEKLGWKLGPTQGDIGSVATIFVPKGSALLGSAGTRRFLEIQGNLGVDDAFTFAPNDIAWFAVFSFEASGYVSDDEKIDPDALLEILKKNNAASNEERKRRGLETLVLEDWFITPHYDVQTKRLEWGRSFARIRVESQ